MNAETLNVLGLVVDAAVVTLIWLVQLIIYPVFSEIPRERFHDWHRKYMNAISVVVIPLMMGQAVIIGLRLATAFSWLDLAAAGCVLAAWGVTFGCSVPCHNALQRDNNETHLVERLVKTNWLRTIAWTAVLVLHLVARSQLHQ